MTLPEQFRFAAGAMLGNPLRAGLMMLAMAIGVASVVMLTALGEGARRYVSGEFSALGTNLVIVLPGRTETTGGHPPLLGESAHDLTLEDARAMERLRPVRRLAPIVVGSATVSHGRRNREVTLAGSTSDLREVRHLDLAQGRFLPPGDMFRAQPVCVLGGTLKRELFGRESALGEWVRIDDRRYRVVGILGSKGRALGLDLDEMAIIPVASAMQLFNTSSLFRVLVEARTRESVEAVREGVRELIRERHGGEDDVTLITQDAILSTFDRVFTAMTVTLGGIAGVSLLVAGILVMNVMLVAVSQRTAEIGLLKALGAPEGVVMRLFLAEALLLALAGTGVGLAVGYGGVALTRRIYPDLPLGAPWWALLAAVVTAVGAALLFGIQPARRAARLDPVQALAPRR